MNCLAVAEDGGSVVAGSRDGTVSMWSINTAFGPCSWLFAAALPMPLLAYAAYFCVLLCTSLGQVAFRSGHAMAS